MALTYALAHSNNYCFARLGEKLGFGRVAYYARLFGYGEKAGLNIPGEQPGHYPQAAPKNGGGGVLTSLGGADQQAAPQLPGPVRGGANGGAPQTPPQPRPPAERAELFPRVARAGSVAHTVP